MARLLITGASGLLGSNLVLEALPAHEVVAVYHRHPIRHRGVTSVKADLAEPGAAQRLFTKTSPEWVIHCAAETDVDRCEAEPRRAYRLNCAMAEHVAEACRAVGAHLVHISTDGVFDGKGSDYRETDVPTPINVYGRSKLEGETAVGDAFPEAVIVRTNLYGWNAQEKLSLGEWFLTHLEQGNSCTGFTNVKASLLLVNHLAPILFKLLEERLEGIYHIVGGDCVSKYAFGLRLAEVFGHNPELIRPISVEKLGLRAPRSHNLCLNTEKIRARLQIELPALDEGLNAFQRLRENGFRSELKSLVEGEDDDGN